MAAALLAAHRNMAMSPSVSTTHDDVEEVDAGFDRITSNHLQDWSVTMVHSWLSGMNQSATAKAAYEASIDGATLLELDAAGWEALGVLSPIERAKLMGAVKKSAQSSASAKPRSPAASSVLPVSQQESGRRKLASEKQMEDFFLLPFCPPCGCQQFSKARTPEGGSEHTRQWVTAIANANLSGTEAKEHFLRFLGMYNVIDLLVFTIDMTYLITVELSGKGPSSVAALLILICIGISTFKTGVAMIFSTIVYNTASAVSSQNFIVWCKLPNTTRSFKLINDLSIYGPASAKGVQPAGPAPLAGASMPVAPKAAAAAALQLPLLRNLLRAVRSDPASDSFG